jgi:hypothetical protein
MCGQSDGTKGWPRIPVGNLILGRPEGANALFLFAGHTRLLLLRPICGTLSSSPQFGRVLIWLGRRAGAIRAAFSGVALSVNRAIGRAERTKTRALPRGRISFSGERTRLACGHCRLGNDLQKTPSF